MRRIYLNDGESAVNVGRFSRFVRTGEFRPPLKGEWYLSDGLDWDWYIVEKMRDNGIFCSALDDALDMGKLRLILSGDQ